MEKVRSSELKAFGLRTAVRGFLSTMIMCGMPLMSHAQQLRINVRDAHFTHTLIEKLADEYNKQNPDVFITAVTTGDSDGSIQLGGDDVSSIGRFVVLPIANSDNEILQNKKVQKGLNGKLERQIFVSLSYLETLDAEEAGEKALPGTVYSLAGSKAFTTTLFAKRLNVRPNQIKGKKILGKEENAITAVRQHSDAISFNVANLIYNLDDGKVGQGLSVFKVDLDGNGKISDEERQAVSNLNSLTAYLEQSAREGLPTGNVSIETSNSKLQQFVNWARQEGQKYLHGQGFLKVGDRLTAQR